MEIQTEYLDRKQKIELIHRIRNGEVAIIGGRVIDGGGVLIENDGQFYLTPYTPKSPSVDLKEFEKLPECTLVILPDNGRM